MKIGIVILNWCAPEDSLHCLHHIQALEPCGINLHIVLVDNGSDEQSKAALKTGLKDFSDLTLIESHTNLGFGGGMNLGAEALLDQQPDLDYLWFLNNDTAPAKDALAELKAYLVKQPGKKIIGPTLLDAHTGQVQCAGGCTYNSWISMERPYLAGASKSELSKAQETYSFDYIYGAAMLVEACFFQQAGGFSSRYFLYFEELELASQCTKEELGWCRKALVTHQGAGSAKVDNTVTAFCCYHAALSSFRYTRYHAPYKLPTVIFARLAGKTLHGITRKQSSLIFAVLLALFDFILNKTRNSKTTI